MIVWLWGYYNPKIRNPDKAPWSYHSVRFRQVIVTPRHWYTGIMEYRYCFRNVLNLPPVANRSYPNGSFSKVTICMQITLPRVYYCQRQFLTQDVAFSIHLSDNRFTARPLATTVVSPPRKSERHEWLSVRHNQQARAFLPTPCCVLYIPPLNNWQLTEVDGSAVKWVRRTVVEPLLKIYRHSGG